MFDTSDVEIKEPSVMTWFHTIHRNLNYSAVFVTMLTAATVFGKDMSLLILKLKEFLVVGPRIFNGS